MGLTYGYLAAWIAGGVALGTVLLVRSSRKPYALPFALLGFGGVGFTTRALGYHAWDATLANACIACVLAAALGYLLQRA